MKTHTSVKWPEHRADQRVRATACVPRLSHIGLCQQAKLHEHTHTPHFERLLYKESRLIVGMLATLRGRTQDTVGGHTSEEKTKQTFAKASDTTL